MFRTMKKSLLVIMIRPAKSVIKGHKDEKWIVTTWNNCLYVLCIKRAKKLVPNKICELTHTGAHIHMYILCSIFDIRDNWWWWRLIVHEMPSNSMWKYISNKYYMAHRQFTVISTWSGRTLSSTRTLYELIYESTRYQYILIGISEMRWKDHVETYTDDGHRVYYNRSADKHEHDVGFIANSSVTNSVMGCQAVSSRIITITSICTYLRLTLQLQLPNVSS